MRRLAALTAGVVLVFTTSGAVANVGAAPAPPSAGIAYNSSTEYVCWVEVLPPVPGTPLSWMYAGERSRFTLLTDICSRATRQFLRQEISPTYWTSSNSSVLSVGSSATNPVTITATGPGSATVTTTLRRASFNYTDLSASISLYVYPRPYDVSITGPGWVMHEASTTCWWYAQVSRGTPPFSYQWYFEGRRVSTGPAAGMTRIRPGAHTLVLYVTDATGATLSARKQFVTTSSWSDLC